MSNTVAETFNLAPRAKTAVIIDGAHLYHLSRGLGFSVDFAKLRTMLSSNFDVRRMCYLLRVAYDEHGEIQEAVVAQLLQFLRLNGYRTIIGEATEYIDGSGRRIVRNANEMAVTIAMMNAVLDGIPEIILFAGSNTLEPVIELCMQRNTRVTLVSSAEGQQFASMDLRASADWFVDLLSLRERIERITDNKSDKDAVSLGARARVVRTG